MQYAQVACTRIQQILCSGWFNRWIVGLGDKEDRSGGRNILLPK